MKANKNKDLQKIAAEIAAILPFEWKYNKVKESDRPDRPEIIGPKGAAFFFRWEQGAAGDKVIIAGVYPNTPDGRYCTPPMWGVMAKDEVVPSIGFSGTRSPSALSRDITRRFLNSYFDIFLRCTIEREKQKKAIDAKKHIVNALGQVAKVTDCYSSSDQRPKLYLDYPITLKDRITGEITNIGPKWSLNLKNLSADTLIKILAVVDSEQK